MGGHVVIRDLATGDDAAQVGALVRRAYLRLEGYHPPDWYVDELADVAQRARRARVVVAEVDGRVVGCLTFVAGADDPDAEHDDPDAASFRFFAVDPAAQGHGVGAAMVRWCIAEAGRHGRARLRIHTVEAMRAARRLYERLGFVRDAAADLQVPGAGGRTVDLLAYRLDL